MRKGTCLAAGGSLLAATIGLFGAAASASASTTSPVVGHTYVNDNTATANTVAGFDRHADGSLTPIPGSPFTVGGAGLGAGLGSQGALQATPDGRYLLAVDAGSNQISVLRVTAGGVPVPVGPPVASGGAEPVSIAISRCGLVYVANAGAGGSNYTGFRLHHDGDLTQIPGSSVAVPDGSGLGDVLFNGSGDHLVGTRAGTSLIDSFVVLPGGRLLAAHGSPFTAQGLGQIGAEFRPTNPTQLFVTNAHNGAGLGTVSAFHDGFFGRLTPIGPSPYADLQTAPCWVEITHDGRYLFTINTASGNVSRYAISRNGALVLLGTTPFTDGAGAVDARLSPDGRTLSVTGGSGHVVTVFAVDGGNLTELPSSPTPLPAGGAPAGIVVL
jgi:6-phosphogluconolactonase